MCLHSYNVRLHCHIDTYVFTLVQYKASLPYIYVCVYTRTMQRVNAILLLMCLHSYNATRQCRIVAYVFTLVQCSDSLPYIFVQRASVPYLLACLHAYSVKLRNNFRENEESVVIITNFCFKDRKPQTNSTQLPLSLLRQAI